MSKCIKCEREMELIREGICAECDFALDYTFKKYVLRLSGVTDDNVGKIAIDLGERIGAMRHFLTAETGEEVSMKVAAVVTVVVLRGVGWDEKMSMLQ